MICTLKIQTHRFFIVTELVSLRIIQRIFERVKIMKLTALFLVIAALGSVTLGGFTTDACAKVTTMGGSK